MQPHPQRFLIGFGSPGAKFCGIAQCPKFPGAQTYESKLTMLKLSLPIYVNWLDGINNRSQSMSSMRYMLGQDFPVTQI
jgi:hypothetical protein